MSKSSTMSLNSLIMLLKISSSFISSMEETDNPACAISAYWEDFRSEIFPRWVKLSLLEEDDWWDGHNSNLSSLLFVCSCAQKNSCLFVRRRAQITKQKKKQKNYSFSCAIRIEKNGAAHEFFDFPSFWLLFVYDKEWPKDGINNLTKTRIWDVFCSC